MIMRTVLRECLSQNKVLGPVQYFCSERGLFVTVMKRCEIRVVKMSPTRYEIPKMKRRSVVIGDFTHDLAASLVDACGNVV